MKNGRIQIQTAKMENKTTDRTKMSNKRYTKARLQYLQRGYECTKSLFLYSKSVIQYDWTL